MGKNTRGNKEFTREQRLVKENKQLKQQVSQLRKQLARLDLDRFDSVKEMLDEFNSEDLPQTGTEFLETLKKKWECNDCRQGFLEIVIFSKIGQPHYFRSCSNEGCNNRTKSQKYSPQVSGIVRKNKNEAV